MMQFFQSRLALWLAFPVGAALALAFAPFGWWWLAILCPAFLFGAWRNVAPRRAAKFGFWFTAGTFLAGTYWIYHSVHIIGHAPVWIAIFLMLGLVSIMGGYTALLGYCVARWLSPQTSKYGSLFRALLLIPAAWTFLEWFRGWFLSGFPWLSLGYSQIDTPLAAFAPLGGVYAISLLTAISAGAVVALIGESNRGRIVAVAALVLVWGISVAFWRREWTQPVGSPVTVAIVQGAVPQDVKWSPEYRDSTIELYRSLTLPHFGMDIILWPESALPILAHEAQLYLQPLSDRAFAKGSRIVTGLVRYDATQDKYYNSLFAMDEKVQSYDKRRLVPFGEFFPVPSFIREWMRLMSLPYTDITAGDREQPALNVNGQKIAATICYEDAYGAEQLKVLKEATLLINVTNDAWFGDSTAAPQHLEISRMRVLEAGRPMLRAANDGISAIIRANADVEKTLPRFVPGVLTGVVQPRTGLTPYARVGNWPVVGVCTAILLIGLWPVVRHLRRRD